MAAEGQSIAHINGEVIFVPFAAPGDLCTIQVTKKKRNLLEGRILSLEKSSPLRTTPPCKYFTVCGGCKWQHIYYTAQLEQKQQQVIDAMQRIGKVEVEKWLPIIGSEKKFHYRNKVEFTFSNRRWLTDDDIKNLPEGYIPTNHYGLGFHIPGRFDKVLDIDECYIAAELANEVRNFIRQFAMQAPHLYTFFDLREQTGLLRTMMVRTSTTGEAMVLISFSENNPQLIETLLSAIQQQFPQITSLVWVLNQKPNDTFNDLEVHCFAGKPYITEYIENLRFKVGAKSFFQTNSEQANQLYAVAREFSQLTGNEVVYDLYTGTGTIANYIAPHAKKVIGIEYVPEAIEDAKENSQLNNIANTHFFAGDMKDILTRDFIAIHGSPDVIITDPPRAGMHENVIQTIIEASPKRIVYVSCNPATQARDVALLTSAGYKAKLARPVDLFPHTHHIENVLLLEK